MSDIRVAVLGVGLMGADHVRRLSTIISGAQVTVVYDYSVERAQQIAATCGARVVTDAFAAIAADDVDAVVIASPGPVHEPQVLACLAAGKPVLCEKPLTTEVESSLAIVKAEAALGRKLIQVGFMRRFDREYAQLRALIADGGLGTPLMMHCVHRNPTVPDHFDSEMIVKDSLVHEVDSTRFLLDEEIASVHVLRPSPNPSARPGLQDPQLTIFETTSGKVVTAEVFVTTGVAYEVRTEVVGEGGSAMIGLDVGLVRKTTDGRWGGEITPGFRERFGDAYDKQVQRWVDAVRSGVNVDGPGAWDGYAAAAVCAAGVQSLRTGNKVAVALADRAEAETQGVLR